MVVSLKNVSVIPQLLYKAPRRLLVLLVTLQDNPFFFFIEFPFVTSVQQVQVTPNEQWKTFTFPSVILQSEQIVFTRTRDFRV